MSDEGDRPAEEVSRLRGRLKWFDPVKGYGFIDVEDGGGDVLVHHSALGPYARTTLVEGMNLTCDVKQGARGRQAESVLEISAVDLDRDTLTGAETVAPEDRPDDSELVLVTVKWFNRVRGYGFAVDVDEGDIFIHMETLRKYGVGQLIEGDRLRIAVAASGRGRSATFVERVSD